MYLMLSKRIGIDLGTANSLVWVAGRGIVLNEPTVVAVRVDDRQVIEVGNAAKEMLGKTPGNIQASRPMRDGVIADYRVTEAMLRYFVQKVCGRFFLFKPEVMICVPAGVTQVERRAVLDATLSAGAKMAYLIDEPLAAAIGAKIPIATASGNMIIDIGGGSAEAAVISLGGVVVHKSVRIAGNKVDEAIVAYMRKRHNLLIGETEIAEAIRPTLIQIVGAARGVLEETPPELASDIIDKGIVMSGGTSLLRNFDRFMTELTGVPCHVAEEPLLCVVRGTGVAIENLDLYKKSVTRR